MNSASFYKNKPATQRLRMHAVWNSKTVPVTPVEGLEKEKKDASSYGTRYFLLSLIFAVVSLPGLLGMAEVENYLMLAVLFSLMVGFAIIGFSLKLAKKDIDYMIEAEEEISILSKKLSEETSYKKTVSQDIANNYQQQDDNLDKRKDRDVEESSAYKPRYGVMLEETDVSENEKRS